MGRKVEGGEVDRSGEVEKGEEEAGEEVVVKEDEDEAAARG